VKQRFIISLHYSQ